MMRVIVGVLAHSNSAELSAQLNTLRDTSIMSPRLVVFNGGSDRGLVQRIGGEEHSHSRQLSYGNLALFHLYMLILAHTSDAQLLVTMDSDVWPGLTGWDERIAHYADEQQIDYMGSEFCAVTREAYEPGACARLLWHRGWTHITNCPRPYRAWNAVQVFGRNYMSLIGPLQKKLEATIPQSKMFGLEEILWPSLAVGMGLRAVAFPAPQPLRVSRQRWHVDELRSVLPKSFGLIHPCNSSENEGLLNGATHAPVLKIDAEDRRGNGLRNIDWRSAVRVRLQRQARVARCRFFSRY